MFYEFESLMMSYEKVVYDLLNFGFKLKHSSNNTKFHTLHKQKPKLIKSSLVDLMPSGIFQFPPALN